MNTRKELLDKVMNNFADAAVQENQVKSSKHKARVTGRFWPTEASAMTPVGQVGRCRRRIYYSQRGETEPEFDVLTLGRFKVGNLIEDWVRDLSKVGEFWKDNSLRFRYTVPNSDNAVYVSGEVDMVYTIDDEIVGGEIKTSYGYNFSNNVFHKKTIPGMPLVSHTMQVMLYLYYFQVHGNDEDVNMPITRFVITYIDRGSMDWIQHVIELSEEGYPVVNGITCKDIHNFQNGIFEVSGLNTGKTQAKLSKYEFTIHNIHDRFNEVFDHHESGLLLPREYEPLLSNEQIRSRVASGEITKTKMNDYNSGKVSFICDQECNWCPYRAKCMEDDGIC